MKDFGQADPRIAEYAVNTFQPEDETLRKVRQHSIASGLPEIQLGLMDALHLEILTRILKPKKVVEIGTLGGYSGVAIARALGNEGRLFTIDINEKNTAVARQNFQMAGVAEKVEAFTGPALLVLPKLKDLGPFDMVFIDADKENYPNYFRWAEANLNSGGLIIGDNTFAFGRIADKDLNAGDRPSVDALRSFNTMAGQNKVFRSTILPTNEGMTLAVKL